MVIESVKYINTVYKNRNIFVNANIILYKLSIS